MEGTRNKAWNASVQRLRHTDAKPGREAKERSRWESHHLPREVREGSPVWTNRARHGEAREERSTKTHSFPWAITTDVEHLGPPRILQNQCKDGILLRHPRIKSLPYYILE